MLNFRLTFLVFAVAFATAHCFCNDDLASHKNFNEDDETKLGIFDGRKSNIKKHPYQVSMLLDGEIHCPGTILSKQWFLTSCFCVYKRPLNLLRVVAGSNDGRKGKIFKIKKVVYHDQFRYPEFDYAYCLLKTKGRFRWSKKIRPAKLPRKQPKDHTNMVVASWGYNEVDEVDFWDGKMKWYPQTFCKTLMIGIPWSPRMVCAYNKGKTTLCYSDFGDGLVYKNVVYGMFIVLYKDHQCTSEALPILVLGTYDVAHWMKYVTGARYEDY